MYVEPGHPSQMWRTMLPHIQVVTVYWIYDMCSRALLTMLLEYPISPAPREGEMVNKHFSQTSKFLSQEDNMRWIHQTFLSLSFFSLLSQEASKERRTPLYILLKCLISAAKSKHQTLPIDSVPKIWPPGLVLVPNLFNRWGQLYGF